MARSSSRLRSEESSSHSGAFSSSLQARTTRGQSRAATLPLRSLSFGDPRPAGDEPVGELRLRHLEREEGDRLSVLGGDVLGDVAHERRLAERGPRGDHDQVPRLEAAELRVEVAEAGGRAGDVWSPLDSCLEAVDLVAEDLGDPAEVAGALLVGDLEQQALGALDQLLRLALAVVDRLLDLLRGREQPPQQRVLLDDLRVVAGVARAPGRSRRARRRPPCRPPRRARRAGPGTRRRSARRPARPARRGPVIARKTIRWRSR